MGIHFALVAFLVPVFVNLCRTSYPEVTDFLWNSLYSSTWPLNTIMHYLQTAGIKSVVILQSYRFTYSMRERNDFYTTLNGQSAFTVETFLFEMQETRFKPFQT